MNISKSFAETENYPLQINLPLSTVICCYLMGSERAGSVKTTLVRS
ncbi:MAG: hypothetical protein GY795_00790 [Desulfobacterales bacterium]|nr:hypothetical protein [Desulfobacterales bacterium]